QGQRCGTLCVAGNAGDPHHGFLDAPHRGDVARAFEDMAEQVEADADVADAGRGESAHGVHARDACTQARMSPNTPAAVTCGPAPGPCTTSGLSAQRAVRNWTRR